MCKARSGKVIDHSPVLGTFIDARAIVADIWCAPIRLSRAKLPLTVAIPITTDVCHAIGTELGVHRAGDGRESVGRNSDTEKRDQQKGEE